MCINTNVVKHYLVVDIFLMKNVWLKTELALMFADLLKPFL